MQVEQAVPGTGGLGNIGATRNPNEKMWLFTGEYVAVFCTNTLVGWRKDVGCASSLIPVGVTLMFPGSRVKKRSSGTPAVCAACWEAHL